MKVIEGHRIHLLHRNQNSKQNNIVKYVFKFLICGAKMLDKCVKSEKKVCTYLYKFDMQCFDLTLKQRQSTYLRTLEVRNLYLNKSKVVHHEKLG